MHPIMYILLLPDSKIIACGFLHLIVFKEWLSFWLLWNQYIHPSIVALFLKSAWINLSTELMRELRD